MSRINMIIHDTENVGNTAILNFVSCIIILAQRLSHTRAAFGKRAISAIVLFYSCFMSNER